MNSMLTGWLSAFARGRGLPLAASSPAFSSAFAEMAMRRDAALHRRGRLLMLISGERLRLSDEADAGGRMLAASGGVMASPGG